jgi:hypothetical protein
MSESAGPRGNRSGNRWADVAGATRPQPRMTTRWLVRTASEQLPEHVRDLAAQAVGLTRDTDVIPGVSFARRERARVR